MTGLSHGWYINSEFFTNEHKKVIAKLHSYKMNQQTVKKRKKLPATPSTVEPNDVVVAARLIPLSRAKKVNTRILLHTM